MDDLGFNKVAGAVLAVGLGMLVLMKLPGIVMGGGHHGEDHKPFAYGDGTVAGAVAAAEPVDLPFPQADWVAAMDEARGAKVFKKCVSCHNNEADGKNGTGPNLYGVVMAQKAVHAGYDYSAALKASPGAWSYESLDAYLAKPSDYAPGTKMNFIGLKKPADRAAVIEYLRLGATTPVARPEPALVVEAPMEAPMDASEEMAATPTDMTVPAESMSMEQTTVDPQEAVESAAEDMIETAKDMAEDMPKPDMDQKVVTPEKLKELE
jgi:cytochrome c